MSETKSKINLSEKVANRIKKEHLKMRSRWVFVAEKLGMEGGLVLSILVVVMLISLILYIMEKNGVFEFSDFGPSGWSVILENIPYDIFFLAILFFLVANFIIKKLDFSFQRPMYIFSSIILVIIAFVSIALFWTGVGHELLEKTTNNSVVGKLYNNKITSSPQGQRAMLGKVVGLERDAILIQIPSGQILRVRLNSPIERPFDVRFSLGQAIKIIGRVQNDIFQAEVIKLAPR